MNRLGRFLAASSPFGLTLAALFLLTPLSPAQQPPGGGGC
jgi:hypothetical protein